MASIDKSSVSLCQTVLETQLKKQMESEVIVPDFLPDVRRVVRADAAPVVKELNCEKDKLTVRGELAVSIVYLPESSRSLRCIRTTIPMEQSFEARGLEAGSRAQCAEKLSYIGCKILNSRKLAVSAGILFDLMAECDRTLAVVTPEECEACGVEHITESLTACRFVGAGEKTFKVDEDIEIGEGKPAAAMLCSNSCHVRLTEQKTVGEKILVKGVLLVKSLYLTDMETGRVDCVEAEIPFNQIVDIDGLEEDDRIICTAKMLGCEYALFENTDGENRIISVSADIRIEAAAYRTEAIELITDAYCPRAACEMEQARCMVENICEVTPATAAVKGMMNLGEGIDAVLSLEGCACVGSCAAENGKLRITGDVAVSALVSRPEGEVDSIEQVIPFECELAIACDCRSIRCRPTVEIENLSYVIGSAAEMEVRGSLRVDAFVRCLSESDYIAGISLGEEESASGDYLVLYYSEPQERLWDIAKRYRTTVAKLRKVNQLEEDTAGGRMILIPKSRV